MSEQAQVATGSKAYMEVGAPAAGKAAAADAPAPSAPPAKAFAKPAEAEAARGPVAVVVVHGIGQQIQFETLDSVVEGLLNHDQPGADDDRRKQRCKPVVRYARVGGKDLPRAELLVHAKPDEEPGRPVHLYEAYWAPLTEGRVQLREVFQFLVEAAWNGWRNSSKRTFDRWMFGGWVSLKTTEHTSRHLGLAAVVLAALVAINVVTSAIFASSVLHQTGWDWVSPTIVAECTVIVIAMLGLVGLLMGLMLASKSLGPFKLALGVVGLAGLALLAAVGWYAWQRAPLNPALAPDWAAHPLVVGPVWGLLSILSWLVRGKLVQYVGDVAVYVTPQKLDRFNELRKEIKDAVCEVVKAVYRHGADGSAPAYESIAIVGHSLGSVAAYDALNSVINTDQLEAGGRLRAVERTKLLLTFGSPLDKTAFIFAAQGRRTQETREALAAAVQPLIQDYAFRQFPWVNVWSPVDIVSGELDFYDDSTARGYSAATRVLNVRDEQASTPLVAHTQYWKTRTIFEQLHSRLV